MTHPYWTCQKHNLKDLTSYCPSCLEEFEHRRPAATLTWKERADTLRNLNGPLAIPFDKLHQWIEELAGRGVWTHELGTEGFALLIEEVESGRPNPANMLKSLRSLGKPILIVTPEAPSTDSA